MNARIMNRWKTEIQMCDDTIDNCLYICATTGNLHTLLDNYELAINTIAALKIHPGVPSIKPDVDYDEIDEDFRSKKVDMINHCVWIGYQEAIEGNKTSAHLPTLIHRVKTYFLGVLDCFGKVLPDKSVSDILDAMDLFGIPPRDIPSFERVTARS